MRTIASWRILLNPVLWARHLASALVSPDGVTKLEILCEIVFMSEIVLERLIQP